LAVFTIKNHMTTESVYETLGVCLGNKRQTKNTGRRKEWEKMNEMKKIKA